MGLRTMITQALAKLFNQNQQEVGRHLTGRKRAEYFLDKGIIGAPRFLDRESRIDWVYRTKAKAFWY